jgi:hypothetical protein
MHKNNIPTTNFCVETETYFKNLPYHEKKETLHFHQYIINKFMVEKDRRGILIYHSMGFGKTLLAASITEAYRQLDPSRKAIVLLPKSLQNNFSEAIKVYMQNAQAVPDDTTQNVVDEHYKFISLNSSNMFTQIGRIDKTPEEVEFEKSIGLLTDKIKDGSLENSVLVIDEFHNLSNAITNGSKNALNLYNKIMNTRNIKLIFLTGTPIINGPFELVSIMNMLKGEELFPENMRDFISYFVDYNEYSIQNKSRFQNRIAGLVSYYGDEYFEGQKPNFPQELPMKVERVPMSKEQFARYLEMREIEKKEEARKFRAPAGDMAQFNQKGASASSSYRIRSRQVSNFLLPGDALSYKGNKLVGKDISKVTQVQLKQLSVYSPKNQKLLENINKHAGQLQLVFSQFTSAEGLGIFAKILEANGFMQWRPNEEDVVLRRKKTEVTRGKKSRTLQLSDHVTSDDDILFINPAAEESAAEESATEESAAEESAAEESAAEESAATTIDKKIAQKRGGKKNTTNRARHFAIYSGDVHQDIRNMIVDTFNSKENMHGEIIEVLLISNQTGGLGLDLHGVRAIHIMEPYWNWALILQIIARGVRYKSHDGFPEKEQNVQPYMYLSVFPSNYKAMSDDEDSKMTTDMHIYAGARNNRKLNESFLLALVEASVDCSIHHKKLSKTIQQKIRCHVCAPTNEAMYEADFYKDMHPDKVDPCKQYEAKKIETKEIIYTPPDGSEPIKYYYNNADPQNVKIYEYSSNLEGYTPLKPSHPFYADLMRVILKL